MEDFLKIAVSPKTPRAYHRRVLRRIAAALRARPPQPRLPADYVMR